MTECASVVIVAQGDALEGSRVRQLNHAVTG